MLRDKRVRLAGEVGKRGSPGQRAAVEMVRMQQVAGLESRIKRAQV